jgi:hypothetical protein
MIFPGFVGGFGLGRLYLLEVFMSSFAWRAARSFAGLSLLALPALLGACGGLVTVVKGDGECVTPQGTFSVGEEFPAGDGCNTCVCEQDGDYSCTLIGCASPCDGPLPPCPPPSMSGCNVESVCTDTGWACAENCDDCGGAPTIECIPPNDCYYTGTFCAGDHYECGDLICDKGCGGPTPDCPPPIDPNCFSYPVCEGDWFCVTECDEPSTCEQQYPEGYEFLGELIFYNCGCEAGSPCAAACADGQACQGIPLATSECFQCVSGNEATVACASEAAFGEVCNASPACQDYMSCLVGEKP